MEFRPRKQQSIMAQFMMAHPRCNIFGSMGVGKTGAALLTASMLLILGKVERIIVIGPLRVVESVWTEEIEKFKESFGWMKVSLCIGSAKERLAALNTEHDILCINFENVPWLTQVTNGEESWIWDMVINDESTWCKSVRIQERTSKKDGKVTRHVSGGSKRAKTIAFIVHRKVTRLINLTGSPAPNGLQDLWGQMFFVDAGKRLGYSSKDFEQRWFTKYRGDDGFKIHMTPLANAEAEIKARIRDISLTVDAKDYFDIKEVIEENIMIDLPPTARRHYLEMEHEFFTEFENHEIEAFNAAGKGGKCLQICSGFLYLNPEGEYATIHDEKIKALKAIVSEANGASLLIRCQYKADRDRILKAFPAAKAMTSKAIRHDFEEGRLQLMVVHAKSAGHGLSLQKNCWMMVDFSYDYNLEHDEQVIERIGPARQAQSGFTRAVFRYRLVVRDTMEQHVLLPVLKKKARLQDAVKEFMKRRNEEESA